MKRIILVVCFLGAKFSSYSQIKEWIYTANLAPMLTYKSTPPVFNGMDTVSIHTLGATISLTNGEFDMLDWNGVPITTQWQYLSIPFVGFEYNVANTKGRGQLYKPKDGAFPIMLSIGVTGGYGGSFLIFPVGVNGTAGLSTDFSDLYFKYGIGYEMWGFSLGMGGYLNLTNNNNSFYKTEPGLELRYIWNWN